MSSAKEIDIKTFTFYFFDYMIDIKNHDPNNIKTDDKSKKTFLFTALFMGHQIIKSLCTSSSATQMDMLKKLMETNT